MANNTPPADFSMAGIITELEKKLEAAVCSATESPGKTHYLKMCEAQSNSKVFHRLVAEETVMTILASVRNQLTQQLKEKELGGGPQAKSRFPGKILLTSLCFAVGSGIFRDPAIESQPLTARKLRSTCLQLGSFLVSEACRLETKSGQPQFLRLCRLESGQAVKGYYAELVALFDLKETSVASLNQGFPVWTPNETKKWSVVEGIRRRGASTNFRDMLINETKDQVEPPAIVIESVNSLEATKWKINERICDHMKKAWGNGQDEHCYSDYFPSLTPQSIPQPQGLELKRRLHKQRIDFSSDAAVGSSFRFKYKIDYRGRLYVAPGASLLNPQGPDEQRSLLLFAEKRILGLDGWKWLCVHLCRFLQKTPINSNLFEAVSWVEQHQSSIQSLARDPTAEVSLEFWRKSKDSRRWSFLAACLEINDCLEWLKNGRDLEEFESDLPVCIDGTCNGFQHMASLVRNEEVAVNTNVIVKVGEDASPKDFYFFVAKRMRETIGNSWILTDKEKRLMDKTTLLRVKRIDNFEQEAKEIGEVLFSQELPGREKSLKRLFMTILDKIEYADGLQPALLAQATDWAQQHCADQFSVDVVTNWVNTVTANTQKSMRESLERAFGGDWPSNPEFRETVKSVLIPYGYGKGLSSKPLTVREGNLFASKEESKIFRELVEETLGNEEAPEKGLKTFRDLFQQLAEALAFFGAGITYQTVDGWGVKVPLDRFSRGNVTINEFAGVAYTSIGNEGNPVDATTYAETSSGKMKHRIRFKVKIPRSPFFDSFECVVKNKLLPNFIHSLDATHLHRVIHSAADTGIQSIQSNHDTIGTHAGSMETVHSIVMEEFAKIYRETPLLKLLEFFRQRANWLFSRSLLFGGNIYDMRENLEKLNKTLDNIENCIDKNSTCFLENGPKTSPFLWY